MIEIVGLLSSKRCRSDQCLQTGTSPDGCPCGILSVLNVWRGDGPWVETRVASKMEGSRSVRGLVVTAETSTGSVLTDR